MGKLEIREENGSKMIGFLAKIFIKDYKNTTDPSVRRHYGVLCGTVGIILNVLLCTGKIIAGLLSGSIAIISDGINNLSDAGSSLVVIIGFKMSNKKPDPDHPFGHGRIEYISGFIVSMIIILLGAELGRSAIGKIIEPEDILTDSLTFMILIVSILVKIYMYFYNRNTADKINSAAMRATAMDSFTDSAATAVVLISTLVYEFSGVCIDGWCGLLVALFVIYTGISAAKDTLDPLLGTRPDAKYIETIEKYVTSQKNILGIHDLVVHDYGPGRTMVSLHAEVPASGDILEVHDTIDNIELKLKEVLGCDAVIHMDPIVTDDSVTSRMRDFTKIIVTSVDESLTMHDFRMVQGPTHTNLIFDVVVPFDFRMNADEVIAAIQEKVRELPGNHFAVVSIDRPYV